MERGCRYIPHSKDSEPSNLDTGNSYTQYYLDLHNLHNHQSSNNNKQNPLFQLASDFSHSSTDQWKLDGATCMVWEK